MVAVSFYREWRNLELNEKMLDIILTTEEIGVEANYELFVFTTCESQILKKPGRDDEAVWQYCEYKHITMVWMGLSF